MFGGINSTAYVISGSADPSAGDGVPSPVGRVYQRSNGGTGTLWLKTGTDDTDWQQVGSAPASEDTSGTPGDATVSSFSGTAAWSGGNQQCVITNPAFPANRQVFLTPVEIAGIGATVRVAVTPPVGGSFTANRSSGSPGTQLFHWRVDI